MRILAVSNIFPPKFIGGYELSAYDLLERMADEGHEVQVITSNALGDMSASSGKMDVIRNLSEGSFNNYYDSSISKNIKCTFSNSTNLYEIQKCLVNFKPDRVVLFNIYGLGVLTLLKYFTLTKFTPLYYLGDNPFHSINKYPSNLAEYQAVMGDLQYLQDIKYLMVSRRLKKEIIDTIGIDLPDVSVAPGWYKTNPECPVPKMRISNKKIKFVFSSQVASHKGTDVIIEAAERLINHGFDQFSIDIYGSGEVAKTMQRATFRNLSKNIKYQGSLPRDQMFMRFQLYDALLLPTWEREPFALVVPEAAASYCIPIMTGAIGAAEWFIDGHDCLKIRRDPIDLAAAMTKLIVQSHSQTNQMKTNAYYTATNYLNFDKAYDTFNSILTDLSPKDKNADVNISQNLLALKVLENIFRRRTNAL